MCRKSIQRPAPDGGPGFEYDRDVAADRREMSIEEAIQVLNTRKHRGFSDWAYQPPHGVCALSDWPEGSWYDEFEAIAIAEKYQSSSALRPDPCSL